MDERRPSGWLVGPRCRRGMRACGAWAAGVHSGWAVREDGLTGSGRAGKGGEQVGPVLGVGLGFGFLSFSILFLKQTNMFEFKYKFEFKPHSLN